MNGDERWEVGFTGDGRWVCGQWTVNDGHFSGLSPGDERERGERDERAGE